MWVGVLKVIYQSRLQYISYKSELMSDILVQYTIIYDNLYIYILM